MYNVYMYRYDVAFEGIVHNMYHIFVSLLFLSLPVPNIFLLFLFLLYLR